MKYLLSDRLVRRRVPATTGEEGRCEVCRRGAQRGRRSCFWNCWGEVVRVHLRGASEPTSDRERKKVRKVDREGRGCRLELEGSDRGWVEGEEDEEGVRQGPGGAGAPERQAGAASFKTATARLERLFSAEGQPSIACGHTFFLFFFSGWSPLSRESCASEVNLREG